MSTTNIGLNSEQLISPFKVFVRVRPFSEKEKQHNEKVALNNKNNAKKQNDLKNIILAEEKLLFVLDPDLIEFNGRREKSFVFDNVFTEKHSNFDIFELGIKSMVDNVIRGYNSTALAYGVTGTGKTHTMFGNLEVLSQLIKEESSAENTIYSEKGVCVYALDYLFDQINNLEHKNFSVKISYLEIYNEQVIDLMVAKSNTLMIVEDTVKGVVVPDLSEYAVNNSKDLLKLILEGNERRTMAATNQNQFSSRSHAILQITIEQRNKTRDTKEEILISKFLIVDLAGSERGGLEKGLRTQEGAIINKSLLSLGNCINILSDKSKKGAFVPYRDSKLTRLLKDSLGGNISTVMISCISPSHLSYDETINTLQYATRARTIQKKITKNVKEVDVHISQYKDIIDSLKNEIDQLKEIIRNQQHFINQNNPGKTAEDEDEVLEVNLNLESSKSSTQLGGKLIKEQNENLMMSPGQTNQNNLSNKKENFRRSSTGSNNTNLNMKKDQISQNSQNSQNKNYSKISAITNNNSTSQQKQIIVSQLDHDYLNKSTMRSVQNVNLEIYKNFLLNASHFNLENMIKLEEEQILENKNKTRDQFAHTMPTFKIDLEKQIDNLQTDKKLLEDYLEKSKVYDKNVNEKYKLLKTFYQKYLELINDKLIENIEQNMILKFNMKEILDLNVTNNQHLIILESQINNSSDDEKLKIKEELVNISNAIEENERIKIKITESLQRNLKLKKILKQILVKLISNTGTASSNNDNKYEQAYKALIREKENLKEKNSKIEKHLGDLIKEKHVKDYKLNEVTQELERLKRQLNEKDKKIKELNSKGEKSNSQLKNNLIEEPSQDDLDVGENISHTFQSNKELNLHEDYFKRQDKKKFIQDLEKIDNLDKNSIQNIKYIINQTNNIVNNNINKVINKEKAAKALTSGTNSNVVSRKNSGRSRIINNSHNSHNNLKNKTAKKKSNSSDSDNTKKSKSPKLKEFDRIIENQLNEVYNKKAKELGEKMKKKIGMNKVNSLMSYKKNENQPVQLANSNLGNILNNNPQPTQQKLNKEFNSIFDKFDVNTGLNDNQGRSLSISRVSHTNDGDFNSELDIAFNLPKTKNSNLKNQEILKTQREEPKKTLISEKKDFNKFISPGISDRKLALALDNKSVNSENKFSKKINVQKFLNISDDEKKSSSNKMLLKNNPSLFNIFSNKDNSVAPRKRDYSPAIGLLKQARLERQLKSMNVNSFFPTQNTPQATLNTEQSQTPSKNQNLNNLNSFITRPQQSHQNSKSASMTNSQVSYPNVNKFVSKNTIEFLQDYTSKFSKLESSAEKENILTNKNELLKSQFSENLNSENKNSQYDLKENVGMENNFNQNKQDNLVNIPDNLFNKLIEVKNIKINKFLED